MRYRVKWIVILFGCIWLSLFVRLVQIQILPHPQLKKFKDRQYKTLITLRPRRGNILDRNGFELASSLKAYSLFADPSLIQNPRKVALKISKKLNLNYRKTYQKLTKKKTHFVWIKRKLNKALKTDISDWKNPGLGFIEESQRVYPKGHLFSQVLGFVGTDSIGLEGLEGYYDHILSAKPFQARISRDAKGRPLLGENSFFFERPEGQTIKLTVDHELQHHLTEELTSAVEKFNADMAVGVILDVQTSQILAMGNTPFFDVNFARKTPLPFRKNKAITDAFEPGSTFKTFTIATALKMGLASPNSQYYCEKGVLRVADRVISEASKKHQFEWLSVSDILSKSSNVCASKMAFEVTDHQLQKFLSLIGFGQKTGVDFWGESRGILPKTPWKKLHLSNVAFGHGVSATPLQIANAYAAIANGGVLHKPYFLKSIIDHNTGREIHQVPQKTRRVMNPDLAKQMQMMLMSVTSDGGTGQAARVLGYPVAGKTGTAQKVNSASKGYLQGAYIASFVGFVPANDPQFVIFVAVDHPKKKSYYGSDVAAPLFSRLSSYALRHYGLPPTIIKDEQIFKSAQAPKPPPALQKAENLLLTKVPDLKGLTIKEVMQKLHGWPIDLALIGRGRVLFTKPKMGENLAKDQKIYLFLEQY